MNNFGRVDRIYLKNTFVPDCIYICFAIFFLLAAAYALCLTTCFSAKA